MLVYVSSTLPDVAFTSAMNRALREMGHATAGTPLGDGVCGANWMQRIHEADLFVSVVSPLALTLPGFEAEWRYAIEKNLPLRVFWRDVVALPAPLRVYPAHTLASITPTKAAAWLLEPQMTDV
ncbi:MAG: hypothetical protein ACLFTK_01820 [Anaerolineales bacterium]